MRIAIHECRMLSLFGRAIAHHQGGEEHCDATNAPLAGVRAVYAMRRKHLPRTERRSTRRRLRTSHSRLEHPRGDAQAHMPAASRTINPQPPQPSPHLGVANSAVRVRCFGHCGWHCWLHWRSWGCASKRAHVSSIVQHPRFSHARMGRRGGRGQHTLPAPAPSPGIIIINITVGRRANRERNDFAPCCLVAVVHRVPLGHPAAVRRKRRSTLLLTAAHWRRSGPHHQG